MMKSVFANGSICKVFYGDVNDMMSYGFEENSIYAQLIASKGILTRHMRN